ncbi:MAG TPA: dethiobiotin synthase [Chitinophagaceae bacterium]|nr:dethiobiotin synthase [Chitinophagaceae bacterium]
MIQTIFVTGTGTGIGKTLVSAILAQALEADYWKPVQAGYEGGTDSEWVRSMLANQKSKVFPELYRLKLPASPHLAASAEDKLISLEKIFSSFSQFVVPGRRLIVEGAGGLMVPMNDHELVIDLVRKLNARVILVSRNYLGSINHSLLTAQACRQKSLRVAGWIFNDAFMDYEMDIVRWSGYPSIASLGKFAWIDKKLVTEKATEIRQQLLQFF